MQPTDEKELISIPFFSLHAGLSSLLQKSCMEQRAKDGYHDVLKGWLGSCSATDSANQLAGKDLDISKYGHLQTGVE